MRKLYYYIINDHLNDTISDIYVWNYFIKLKSGDKNLTLNNIFCEIDKEKVIKSLVSIGHYSMHDGGWFR